MSTKDLLVEAKNLLLTHGWTQGSIGSQEKGYCALGALDAAAVNLYGDDDSELYHWYSKAEDALREQLREQGMIGAVAIWNDAGRRTQQEVLDLLDSAARSVAGE